jgi:outer membrane lipase/esterase
MKSSMLLLIVGMSLPNIAAAQSASSQTPGPSLVTLPGQNFVQRSMGVATDNSCPSIPTQTPGQVDLQNLCTTMINTARTAQGVQPNVPSWELSVTQTNNFLQQVNGGAVLAPVNQAASVQSSTFSVIAARLTALRAGPGGISIGGGGQSASLQFASLQVAQAPALQPALESPWGLFFNGVGDFGSKGLTSFSDSYRFGAGGFSSGVDYRFSPALVAGIGLAYLHTNVDFDRNALSAPGQSLTYGNITGSVYSTYNVTDALYLDGILSIGGSNYDSRRHIVIPSNDPSVAPVDRFALGSFGGRTYLASIDAGYTQPFGAWTLTPTLRFDAARVEAAKFTEQEASGLDLSYGSAGQNAFLTSLGLRVNYAISTDFGVVIPQAKAEWVHQYNNGRTQVTAQYANDPTGLSAFTVLADKPGRNYAVLSASVLAQLPGDIAAYLAYNGLPG